MKRAIGYTRVSTDDQAENGASLDAQSDKIRAMASVQDAELIEVISDGGFSAKNLDRPGVQKLLELVKARKVDVVILAKLDRLTRSVRDLADLIELFNNYGVALVSSAETLDTGTAAGRMMMNIFATVSQWEREVIGERTREVLQHMKSLGKRTGTVPYGYRAEGSELVGDQGEQAVMALTREFDKDGLGLREIADLLNAAGYRTRRGTEFQFQYVARILKMDLPKEGEVPIGPPADPESESAMEVLRKKW